MNKTSNTSSVKGLSGLAVLAGLVVKETPSLSDSDLAIHVKATAPSKAYAQKAKEVVRVMRDSKGRGGKTVTVVTGVTLPDKDLDTLGKQLKAACGSGGTVKEGVIEIQGDHIDRVVAMLCAQGYKAKRARG